MLLAAVLNWCCFGLGFPGVVIQCAVVLWLLCFDGLFLPSFGFGACFGLRLLFPGINDPTLSTSIEIKPINLYEMPMDEDEPFQEEHMQCTNTNANLDDNHEDEVDWSRNVEENSHNMDVE
ncbi:hypothetical protein QYF36_018056 [Acer negundo]|nr:hypothetical protein QYF36_018056 [Acer negundo]